MAIETELPLLQRRRTRIVATVGPASDSEMVLGQLVEAGVNVFRLNCSHGNSEYHEGVFHRIRRVAEAQGRTVGILADLAGPKIRTGRFKNGQIELVRGDTVTVTTRDVMGEPGLIPSQYGELAKDVKVGDRVLLADGVFELKVLRIDGSEIGCEVIVGGILTDRKGINLPGVAVSAPCLTEKDERDAEFLLNLGVDFFGLSFVRSSDDIVGLRELIRAHGTKTPPAIVAKIERPEALEVSDAVLRESDAIMVARGDLGVELPPEQVPIAQRQLIDQARRFNKPVIVATQMLESMVEHSRPTRAEVSDVSHAVMAGADAIMLSGETATGAYPVDAVEMMDRIARQAEGYLWSENAFGGLDGNLVEGGRVAFGDAVARSTAQLSRDVGVRAIFVVSQGGMSAVTVSSARPAAPIVALSSQPETCRRMALMWGVIPHWIEESRLEEPIPLVRDLALRYSLANENDLVLLVRGFNANPELNTPSITLLSVR